MQNVVVLVDVQNMYYTNKEASGRNFDYNAFWAKATDNREVIAAYAYAIDRGDVKQQQFQNILRAIGFEVKLKPFIQRSDGSAKGDWDVGIALDGIEWAERADVLVLASGDGDFSLLVDKARQVHGCTVEVYGAQSLTADGLIAAATTFFPIEDDLLL